MSLARWDLREVPPSIRGLTGLRVLDLSGNQLEELPDWLADFSALQSLDVSSNKLTELPGRLGELGKLRHLDLALNQLTTLPEGLRGLARLRLLGAASNQLSELPPWLGELSELRRLDVSFNYLRAVPDSLGSLPRLEQLKVSGNWLARLPATASGLTHLRSLDLSRNRVTELPEWLGGLTRLEDLDWTGNPLVSPPPEVTSSGEAAVRAFLKACHDSGVERLWRSKVLIVGEATVGKTSLFRQLTGGKYDPDEPQTHGVHIDGLTLPLPDEPGTPMELSTWDFGGQLEYRATQRFYLTDRSLFILVWNARRRWPDGNPDAWLETIAARAPHSPIIVVATHIDDTSPAWPPEDLSDRHPQVVASLRVDASTGSGIDALREAIRDHAARLPLMGAKWPLTWASAAQAVRELDGLAVNTSAARQAMAQAGVTDADDQRTILTALHDLGDVVHFSDDLDLSRKVVLKPSWMDARITEVLDSQQVKQSHGMLSRSERSRLWGDLEDQDMADRLLRMMERFDLAYRVGDESNSEDVALIVESLGQAPPAEVSQQWDQALLPDYREVGVSFKLRSRQAGIPTWFIARMHRYTTGMHWSHGVLLHDRDPDAPSWALLVDDGRAEPTVTLRVRGQFPVRFLSVLWEAFKNVIQHRYRDLIETTLVPCSCTGSGPFPCPHAYSLRLLIVEATDASLDADHKVRCEVSRLKVDARTMLDGLPEAGIAHELAKVRTATDEIGNNTTKTLDGIRALTAMRTQAGIHCPSLFQLEAAGRTTLLLRRQIQIRLWCEWPYPSDGSPGPSDGGPHPLPEDEGTYLVKQLPPGLRAYLPYLRLIAAALGVGIQMVPHSLFAAGKELTEKATRSVETADKILEALGDGPQGAGPDLWHMANSTSKHDARWLADTPADFRALREALRELDPQERWGGLSPVPRPEDPTKIIYVCRRHYLSLMFPFDATAT